ncbi:hypothetical protein Z043_101740 [Scleropages formosus]|uniref:Ig-like domain-containing protein n=1 Tax=Scleropages formosus TaxID=113540 RepID=A0A0N8K2U8_SCLFO|nr:hypothetical protein Z043_101740 [Scleropages formosus]
MAGIGAGENKGATRLHPGHGISLRHLSSVRTRLQPCFACILAPSSCIFVPAPIPSLSSSPSLTIPDSSPYILTHSASTIALLLDIDPDLPSDSHDVAPYFKTEPGAAQIHLEGNRLVLTCLAEGSWPLEFKWMLNGTDVTAFSPEYKYTIPSLQRSHAGFYQCIVRNRMGVLMQKRAEVQVAYMGNFVEQEQRKTVAQGKAAVLNCPVVHSFPRPQVTWFRDGYKIIPSEKV